MGICGKGKEAENTICTFRLPKLEKEKLRKLCEKLQRDMSDLIREGLDEIHEIYGDGSL